MNGSSEIERRTLEYYDLHAADHARRTLDADLGDTWDAFLSCIPAGGSILDAGCGSGRDTRRFRDRGFRVTAIDASRSYAADTRRRTGIDVRVLRFQDMEFDAEFDGIWASASLLHVPRVDLVGVLARLARALRPGGVLYASLKYGTEERVDEFGRYFNDVNEAALNALLGQVDALELHRVWTNRGGRDPSQRWIHALVKRARS